MGGGNPKISKEKGPNKIEKRKEKGVVSQKKRGSKKEKRKHKTSLARKSKRKRPNRRGKKEKKEKKKPKRQETLLFWPQKNVSNWGGSTGSRLQS